jgi:hypothetical protein
MADQWKIEFDNTTMLTASEGVYEFTHGLFKRIINIKKLPLGCYNIAFDSGFDGAEHQLKLIFLTTNRTMSTYISRIQGFFDGTVGTLKVPDYPDMPNCVITDVTEGPQTAIQMPVPLNQGATASAGDEDPFFANGYRMDFTINFTQLRP